MIFEKKDNFYFNLLLYLKNKKKNYHIISNLKGNI